jgi:hypothetical protein
LISAERKDSGTGLKANRERRAIQTALPGPIREIKPEAVTTAPPAVMRGKNSLKTKKKPSKLGCSWEIPNSKAIVDAFKERCDYG